MLQCFTGLRYSLYLPRLGCQAVEFKFLDWTPSWQSYGEQQELLQRQMEALAFKSSLPLTEQISQLQTSSVRPGWMDFSKHWSCLEQSYSLALVA